MLEHIKKLKNKLTSSTRAVPNPKDSDIYLVSYPKSGNTWMRYLLAYALWPELGSPDMTELGSYVPSYSDKQQLLDPSSPCNKSNHRIIKEHFLYQGVAQKNAKRVIYICRDGRDAIVSYWHFCNQRDGTSMSLGEFIKQSTLPSHSYGPWQEHVLGWLHAKLQHKLIIRYEDMLDNPEACLKEALNFAEFQVDDLTLKDAVNRASFGSLKKLEQEKGFNYEGVNNVEFVRKGVAGGWADHFSSEDLDLFDRYHGGPIPELGYDW